MAEIDSNYKYLTYKEMAKDVAEKALDEFLYNGKSIREWMQIITSEDCISRQAVLEKAIYFPIARVVTEDKVIYRKIVFADEIENIPPVTPAGKVERWISVSERLPKTRDEVLIFLANGQITIASYNDHFLPFFNKPIGWGVDAKRFVFDFCSDDVIAWMPLPEPYKASPTGAEGSEEE